MGKVLAMTAMAPSMLAILKKACGMDKVKRNLPSSQVQLLLDLTRALGTRARDKASVRRFSRSEPCTKESSLRTKDTARDA